MAKGSGLSEEPVDTRGKAEVLANASGPDRARRLFGGWSANPVADDPGVTQQVALIPVFCISGAASVLAGWLVVYAVGNLTLIADSGLQFRAINRFWCSSPALIAMAGRRDSMRRCCGFYLGLAGVLVVLVLIGTQLVAPSAVLGFQAIADFNAAFIVMTAGMLLTLPAGTGISPVPHARALWPRGAACNWSLLAGRSVIDRDRRHRKLACRHHRLCGDADFNDGLSAS